MKKEVIIVLVLSLVGLFAGKLNAQDLHKTQMLADIDYLVDHLKEIHPNPFANYPESQFNSHVELVKTNLEDDLSVVEFSKRIIPLFTLLKDGHTEIQIPNWKFKEYLADSGKVIPIEIQIGGENKLKVLYDYSGALTPDSEILSINGMPSTEILERMRSYTSAESEVFRNAVISRRFRILIWFLFGKVDEYKVVTEGGTKIIPAVSNNIYASKQKADKVAPYSFQLTDNNIGVISFNAMSGLSTFKSFLAKSFAEMSDKNVKNLVIDVRQNGGGDSRLGDALIAYLTKDKYKQVDYMEVKSSKTQKKYFYKNYFKWFVYPAIPIFKLTKVGRATLGRPGKHYRIDFKEKKPAKIENRFVGNVYLLTSNFTFSSAVLFSNAFKCYNLGQIVGEETGGQTITYGDIVSFTLPHSKILAEASFKKFVLACADQDGKGVKPDHEVEANDALEYVVSQLIK